MGGLIHIIANPDVLVALNPVYGVKFVFKHGLIGLTVLGLVFLAVTGAEALYADLGHFGRKPIQTAWLGLVLPALMSTISARARSFSPIRRRSTARSTCSIRSGRLSRW